MTPLRRKLIGAIRAHNLRPSTEKQYVDRVRSLAEHFRRSPDELSPDEIRDFFGHLALDRGFSSSTLNQHRSALLFFYRNVVDRPDIVAAVPKIRVKYGLPTFVRVEDFRILLNVTNNRRHRCSFILAFGLGLRLEEVVSLRGFNVDARSGLVIVRDGKGGKDRSIALSRLVYREIRPLVEQSSADCPWLFPGLDRRKHMARRSVQRAFRDAVIRAGLQDRKYKYHSLRHGYATEFLRMGGDIRTLQNNLGHSSIKTTMRYLHLTPAHIP